MTNLQREKVVVDAVRTAKNRQFGLTAIKVELEARFNREMASTHERCIRCEDCDDCGGDGEVFDSDNDEYDTCQTCSGRGRVCPNQVGTADWSDMKYIHDRILRRLVRVGLAERKPRTSDYRYANKYRPKHPLVFSKVYHDATVDTEITFTLALDKPENILLLPKILKAFYALKDEIGQEVDISNAGMHISLINDPEYHYPGGLVQGVQHANFQKSMILLMPALYFLGSSNGKTRPLIYRKPGFTHGKYNAISYRNGALEFRVFDTCYDTPEAILDNVVVTLNCLRFWTKKYTRNYLAKIANNVPFGVDGSDELKRLFVTREHIDLLNRGLRMIKPSYYTVGEVKRQRNFTYTKIDANNFSKDVQEKLKKEYEAYERKFDWENVMRRNSYINHYIENYLREDREASKPAEEVHKEATAHAEERVRDYRKDPLEEFSRKNLKTIGNVGEYELCVV